MKPKEGQKSEQWSDSVAFTPNRKGGIFVTEKEVTTAEFNSAQEPDFNYHEKLAVVGVCLEINVDRQHVEPLIQGNIDLLAKYVTVKESIPGEFVINGPFYLDGEYFDSGTLSEYGPYQHEN